MRTGLISVGVTAVLICAVSTRAANLLTNPSFETVTTPFGGDGGQDLGPGSTVVTGWTVITNDVAPLENGNSYGVVAENGSVSLDLQSYGDGSPYGGMQQSIATVALQEYELTAWVGVDNDAAAGMGPASVTATAGSTSMVFSNTLAGPGMQWEQGTMDFVATGSSTTISLTGLLTTGGQYIGLDNVDVEAIPEPATGCVLFAAASLLCIRRRR